MSGSNASARAYDAIRDMTISFDIPPDARINEVELAAKLDMSRAPVREALNRLVADGLVVFEPRKGFRCRRLSVKEISDLFAVRADIETAAVREAAMSGDNKAAESLKNRWSQIIANAPTSSVEDLVTADEDFHAELVALSGNMERVRFLNNIKDRIQFVRRINLDDPERCQASLSEHLPILEAVIAGRGEEAASLLSKHLQISSDEVRRHVETGLARIYAKNVA